MQPFKPEEDQAIFDYVEKFGGDGVEPVVPKMSLREPLPPAWFADQLYEREYEEEKERERQIVRVFLKVK